MAMQVDSDSNVKSEPVVVPLCDVLLVLLIIFMVVTPLIHKGIDVRLPAAINTINLPENPDVVLAIKRDGRMFLNGTEVTLDKLTAAVEEAFADETGERKIYIKADGELEYGAIVEAFEKIKDAGVDVMGIITEIKTKEE